MSTRGSFIIRRGDEAKELYISADAYPDGAGRDAVRLIKSLDLDRLFDLLMTEDDVFEFFPEDEIPGGEPHDFSLRLCMDAVRSGKPYVYQQMGKWFIQDSLTCEYGYEIVLDDRLLFFYIGDQKERQRGNRYDCEPTRAGYYPCHLKAIFAFDYIRQNETDEVVRQMYRVEKENKDQLRNYVPDPAKAEIPAPKKQGVRQLIIARKDLQMSPGKLAAQVSHASMAFIADMLRRGGADEELDMDTCEVAAYHVTVALTPEIYNDWLNGIFTKTICEARNRNHLMKAVTLAEELGLREGRDFFLIRDSCLTELEPEEYDENGVGRTLTCIGFRPLRDEIAHAISRKYQLYR